MNASDRLERQAELLGEDGIRKIRATTLGIVGLSGNGSPVALGAVCTGFRNFRLFDPDRLQMHNLNRFLAGGVDDVRQYKVDLVKDAILRLDPSARCQVFRLDARGSEAQQELATCDIIMACVDNDGSRLSLQEFCAERNVPLIEIGCGVVLRKNEVWMFGCKMSYYRPGKACLGCISLDDESMVQSHQSFVGLNMVASGLAVLALVGLVTGRWETKNFVEFDARQQQMMSLHVEKRPQCEICGRQEKET